MKIASRENRVLVLNDQGKAAFASDLTNGRYDDPASAFADWEDFRMSVEKTAANWDSWAPVDTAALDSPSPEPSQIFAIGVNYAEHGSETNIELPKAPMVFTKFSSSVTGPETTVTLPQGNIDWEIELVAVIGREAHQVSPEDAWDYVAGLTIGQDLSERVRQFDGPYPQFGLAKSFPGFSPVGPFLVTPDEFSDLDDIPLRTTLNGQTVQDGNTRDLIFKIPELISRLSEFCALKPGDMIFTGTPDGVGMGLEPPVFLQHGDELISEVPGIGQLRQIFSAG